MPQRVPLHQQRRPPSQDSERPPHLTPSVTELGLGLPSVSSLPGYILGDRLSTWKNTPTAADSVKVGGSAHQGHSPPGTQLGSAVQAPEASAMEASKEDIGWET